MRVRAGTSIALVVSSLTLLLADDARACSFSLEVPTVDWPTEGEPVPLHARLLLTGSPAMLGGRLTLHDDTRGLVVETSTLVHELSAFQPLVIVVPTAPLEPEHAYRLTYQNERGFEPGPIDIRRFRALDRSPAPGPLPPPPSLRWFQQVVDRPVLTSCGDDGHRVLVTISAPAILPPSWWVRGRIETAGGLDLELGALSAGQAAMQAEVSLGRSSAPTCVEAAIVDDRGRVGPLVRDCLVDKCTLSTVENGFSVPRVDWSTVPEGCHAHCRLQDGEVHVCTCDPGHEGVAMLCTAIGTSTHTAEPPPELPLAEPGCGCASTPTSARTEGASIVVVGLLVLGLTRLRGRGPGGYAGPRPPCAGA